jgi:hypothetical protein
MASKKNVTAVFVMDEKRLQAYESRLKPLESQAEELRQLLNSKKAVPAAGAKWIGLGVATLLLAIVVWVVLLGDENRHLVIVLSLGCIGLWLIGQGVREQLVGRDIRRRAATAQRVLEGRDGFLWRFETLLTGYTNRLPAEVEDSLRVVAQRSKDGLLSNSHYELRAYWYWASALGGRIRGALATEGQGDVVD